MNQWKPMSEKPPKPGWYLVFAPAKWPHVKLRCMALWNGDKWGEIHQPCLDALTHWADWPADPPMEEEATE